MVKLIITKSKKEAVKKAGEAVSKLVSKKQDAVLGLATGGTMIPFYRELVRLYRGKKVDFSKIRTFNLDEYVGLKGEDLNSYHYFMNKHFFRKVNIKPKNIHFPSSENAYDRQIKKAGGMDLCMLGIGEDGHIGFNEPRSPFKSRTRKIKLTENTREANSRFFRNKSQVPHYSYTMGIKTILEARKIILLSFGNKKANAIRKSLKGKITEQVPASILRKHKDATFIIDKKSAKRL